MGLRVKLLNDVLFQISVKHTEHRSRYVLDLDVLYYVVLFHAQPNVKFVLCVFCHFNVDDGCTILTMALT